MGENRYHKLLKRAHESADYWAAGPEADFTDELSRVMEEQQVSRAELARRLGSSQAYVTKVLRGNANFTLATMTKLARALDMEVEIRLRPTPGGTP